MRRRRGERGQILPVVTLALVALARHQRICDRRRLRLLREAPAAERDRRRSARRRAGPADAATAIATATSYAAANTPANLSTVDFTYQTKCTAAAVAGFGCSAATNPNALVVNGTASTNTWFAKIFGIGNFDVTAHANACSPCSSTPVDVVVALDRTGSMCDSTDANGCKDLNNAKDGVHTLLSMLNPPYAQVGMVAFPPLATASTRRSATRRRTRATNYTAYDSANRRYLTDQISEQLQERRRHREPSSGLYLHTVEGDDDECVRPNGYTSYSEALRQAKKELDAHGRANVPDVIVFLTDGEANIGSVYGPRPALLRRATPTISSPARPRSTSPTLKAQGVTIYSIGYALGTNKKCTAGDWEEIPAEYNKKGKLIDARAPVRSRSRRHAARTRRTTTTRARRSTPTTPSRTSHRRAASTTSRPAAT